MSFRRSRTPSHLQEHEHRPGPNDQDSEEVYVDYTRTDSDSYLSPPTYAPSHSASFPSTPDIKYSEYSASGSGLASHAHVQDDGRIAVSLKLQTKLPELPADYAQDVREFAVEYRDYTEAHPINIVIITVGSRGDVQSFLALGLRLKADGHRVRIVTHATFGKFVRDAGLEFFSIGGNLHELMSYMVKNPGMESLRNGDIGEKRKMLREILESLL